MIRQIGPHYQEPSMIVLQERIHRLENTVTACAEVLRELVGALEAVAAEEPPDGTVAEAAKRAREVLRAVPPLRGGQGQRVARTTEGDRG